MPTGIYKRRPMSSETKLKISIANKGRVPSAQAFANSIKARVGQPGPMKGKQHSMQAKLKLSLASKGRTPWNKGKTKQTDQRVLSYASTLRARKIRPSFLGRRHSEQTKKKLSALQQGIHVVEWTHFVTPENRKIRNSVEAKTWRRLVFERDNYTCVWCGDRSAQRHAVILNADHIKPFALFPELRFSLDNGRTLCKSCHIKTSTHGRRVQTLN